MSMGEFESLRAKAAALLRENDSRKNALTEALTGLTFTQVLEPFSFTITRDVEQWLKSEIESTQRALDPDLHVTLKK